MLVPRCVCCAWMYIHIEARIVFFSSFPPWVLRQGLSLTLELTDSARLAGPQGSVTLLSLPLQWQHAVPQKLLTWVLGRCTHVFMLAKQALFPVEPSPQPCDVFSPYGSVVAYGDAYSIFFLLRGVFAIWALFCFHINFKIFSVSVKNDTGILMRTVWNPQIAFDNITIFTTLILRAREHRNLFISFFSIFTTSLFQLLG